MNIFVRIMGGRGAGDAPYHGRKRGAVFLVAHALLAAPLLMPSAAYAVICSNGGAGPNPAGNDGGDLSNTVCGLAATTFGGSSSTAIGAASMSNATASTAIGSGSMATGIYSTATGTSSVASGDHSTANGINSTASGNFGTAMGSNSKAQGDNSVAIGSVSSAGTAGVAIGSVASAGPNGTAVGTGAQANYNNSAAFGNGAVATVANEVAIGTASNAYKLSGLTSAASLAAQSGPVSFVTTDAAGHLAATNLTLPDISGLQSSVGLLQQQMKQSFEGTAIAISMGSSASFRQEIRHLL